MPCIFFFNDTATTEIYTLSLHDALPISLGAGPRTGCSPRVVPGQPCFGASLQGGLTVPRRVVWTCCRLRRTAELGADRKSTRLNSSHSQISYAVFCLKKNNTTDRTDRSC